jgi:hypothetical protein
VSAHDSGVNHHVLVVVVAGQKPENPLENAAGELGPQSASQSVGWDGRTLSQE